MEEMDAKLNDQGEVRTQNKSHNLFYLIVIFLLFVLTLVFLILFILSSSKKKDLESEKNELNDSVNNLKNLIQDLKKENDNLTNLSKDLKEENDALKKNLTEAFFKWEMFGEKYINISYYEDGILKNSFGKGGNNFKEEIGDINNHQDYTTNERTVYDLYIPFSATQKKDQYNRIILFIHGGDWLKRNKTDFDVHCRTYGSLGFITATMGYTVLLEQYGAYNMFRIIDEITATIKSIKKELVEKGFDGDKLEMAMGGYSAGAHLCLTYAYGFAKDSVIPIKFVLSLSAPVTLLSEYFVKLAKYNDTLDNIDMESIKKGKSENKVVLINGENGELSLYLAQFVNLFLGRNANDDIEEMYDFEKKEIKKSEKYIELYKKVSYVLPIDYVNNTTIPTICVCGGNDVEVGIGQYAFLEEKFNEYENNNLTLIYSRYATHNPYELITENGIIKSREMIYSVIDFAEKYFTKN